MTDETDESTHTPLYVGRVPEETGNERAGGSGNTHHVDQLKLVPLDELHDILSDYV